jgi:CRISPR-associated protein Csx3
MAPLFPAVLIAGPTDPERTRLINQLSHALAQQHVSHYVLRDMSMAAPGDDATALLGAICPCPQHAGTRDRAAQVNHAVAHRHLPVLLDMPTGGPDALDRPAIHCTHALVIVPGMDNPRPWQEAVAGQGLVLLAVIRIDMDGQDQVSLVASVLHGVIGGGGDPVAGPCFSALLTRLAQICGYDAEALYRAHLALLDLDLVLHIERPIYPLPAHPDGVWQPDELPTLLASLPLDEPLGIYGRGPIWLYAALAACAAPAHTVVFDRCQGWVTVPRLGMTTRPDMPHRYWQITRLSPACIALHVTLPDGYLDQREAAAFALPAVPSDQGVVLTGNLPAWLWAALAQTYTPAAWIACCAPDDDQAVVVYSRQTTVPVGSTWPLNTV